MNKKEEEELSIHLDSFNPKTFSSKSFLVSLSSCNPLLRPLSIPKLHNHLSNNYHLSNKKALFHNLNNYLTKRGLLVGDYIPVTFHIKDKNDTNY
jgi:hypothetical protein